MSLHVHLADDDCSVLAKPVLLAILPLTSVNSAIGPRVFTITLLLTSKVFTFILFFVLPSVKTDSLHLTLVPLANVDASISPRVGSETVNHVVPPVTLISRAVLPLVESFALPLAILIHASIFAIGILCRENLSAKPMLKAVLPVSGMSRTLGGRGSFTVALAVCPGSLVRLSTCISHFSLAVGLAVPPLSFEHSSIDPLHSALAVSKPTKPFSLVNRAVEFICVFLILTALLFELVFKRF